MRIEKSLEDMVDTAMNEKKLNKQELKESVTNDIIQQAIFDKFGAYMTDAFEELVTDVCDRIEDFADTSDVDSCIDDALIYDDEKWTLMRHYQNPDEANYDEALTRFIEDIYEVCSKIVEADEDDAEDEETDESLKNESKNTCDKKVKRLQEEVTYQIIRNAIFDTFGNHISDEFRKIVKNVCDEIGDFADVKVADTAIDDALISEKAKWEMLQYYQAAVDADYDSAYEEFKKDIYTLCTNVLEAEKIDAEDKFNSNESLKRHESYGDYQDYDKKDGWTEDDIELHKSIDWKARNYNEYRIEDDSFEDEAIKYYNDKNPETKKVKFIKFMRANPIYPPYYAPAERAFDDCVGPMYDGHTHKGYDVHDRYETQELYNMLSENKKCNEDVNPLSELKKEPVIELDDGTILGIEYDNGRLFAGTITNSGIIKEYYIDYDAELSLDSNLEKLMEVIGNDAELSSGWMEVASKEVCDSNGDMTDYTWYTNKHGLNIFMFGDKDVTDPDVDYADWETESDTEAQDWFDNYTGFEDDEDEDDLELTDDDMNAGQWYESFNKFVEHKLNSIPKMTNEALIKEYRIFRRSNHDEDKAIKEALKTELKNRKNQ